VTQENNSKLQRIKQNLERGKSLRFIVQEDRTLRFQNHLYVPINEELRKKILEEAHNTRYAMHPGGTKMYRDLRQYFWWNNMKKEIGEHANKCLICQRLKLSINVLWVNCNF